MKKQTLKKTILIGFLIILILISGCFETTKTNFEQIKNEIDTIQTEQFGSANLISNDLDVIQNYLKEIDIEIIKLNKLIKNEEILAGIEYAEYKKNNVKINYNLLNAEKYKNLIPKTNYCNTKAYQQAKQFTEQAIESADKTITNYHNLEEMYPKQFQTLDETLLPVYAIKTQIENLKEELIKYC